MVRPARAERMQAVVDVYRTQCAATRQRGQGMEQGGGIGAAAEGHTQRVLRRRGELGGQVLDERGGQWRRGTGSGVPRYLRRLLRTYSVRAGPSPRWSISNNPIASTSSLSLR